jgi:hypothetical protein
VGQRRSGALTNSGTLLDGFEDASTWNSGTASFVSDDTSWKLSGSKSMLLTGGAVGATRNRFKTVNWSFVGGGTITLRAFVPEPNLQSLTVYFISSTGSKYWQWSLNNKFRAGDNHVVIHTSELTAVGGMTLADPVVQIQLQMATRNPGVAGPTINLDALYFNRTTRPTLLFCMDDGLADVYSTALPIFSAANVPATSFVISSLIGSTGTYMTTAQLAALYAAGWDLGNHTATHPHANGASTTDVSSSQTVASGGSFTLDGSRTSGGVATFDKPRALAFNCVGIEQGCPFFVTGTADDGVTAQTETVIGGSSTKFTSRKTWKTVTGVTRGAFAPAGAISLGATMAQDEYLSEVETCRTWLEGNGWTRASKFVSYPFNEHTVASDAALAQGGYLTGFTSFNTPARNVMSDGVANPYDLQCIGGLTTSPPTLATAKGWVDSIITAGTSGMIWADSLTPFGSANLTSLVQYAAAQRDAGLLDIVTISQWWAGR